ncbi:MAG: phenylalanine--tRNA ligase subunit beta [Treponema sp.]|nr:phenylalanine--tRNA ligase subunit beta [Treponema sp.]
MPKVEVNEKLFFNLVGKKYDMDDFFEKKLTHAKAELDEKPDMSQPENDRVIKIELNDTNRPDLWSTGGIARCLREYDGAAHSDYSSFLSTEGNLKDSAGRVIDVDPELKTIRPYLVAFVISGKPIDEPMLKDIIQTQEKLCWNFGRKRKTISMGVYRQSQIKWPVHQTAADPDTTRFVPLQCNEKQTLREIVATHPKGKEYGWILKDFKKYPLLVDDNREVLSMAPIINSADLGAVEVGDSDLLVELTGDDMGSLMLSANIVACDFFDAGYKILPVKIHHAYDTGFGQDVVTPYYFQSTTDARLSAINRKLGVQLTKEQVQKALEKMGNSVTVSDKGDEVVFTVKPAPYRNDFLHEVDVIEDVMIGMDLDFFDPAAPNDFTVGRLLPITTYSRKVKEIMAGMGYQEMIFNYLGSKKTYIDNMGIDGKNVIEIANPMSENYQFIRPSIIASLFEAEAQSGNAVYPHKTFEVGKIAYIDPTEKQTGTRTIQSLGFLVSANNANFNNLASEVSTLLYYLDHKYEVKETEDPRFIPGRQAGIIVKGKQVGIFGEIHPQVLENWQVGVPCAAGELDLEFLMANETKDHASVPQNDSPKNEPKKESPKGEKKDEGPKLAENQTEHFNKYIELKVAKIISVENNPQGEKLYIEHLDDGSGTERIIQSGLRPYLQPEELLGQHVIIAANLAPRKMRGVESHGMLLAADYMEDGKEKVELLTAPWAVPGTPVVLEGSDPAAEKPAKIDIDRFCKVEIRIAGKAAQVAGVKLVADGKAITTLKSDNCLVE